MIRIVNNNPNIDSRRLNATRKYSDVTGKLALFCAFMFLGIFPFDILKGPSGILICDALIGIGYIGIYALNRIPRFHVLCAHLLLVYTNTLLFSMCVLLGEKSATHDMFYALAIFPFLVFSLNRIKSLCFYVFLPFLLHIFLENFGFEAFSSLAISSSGNSFKIQASILSFLTVGYCLYFLRKSNADAEAYLRDAVMQLGESQRSAKVGTFTFNKETQKIWWSDEMYSIAGRKRREFIPGLDAVIGIHKKELRDEFRGNTKIAIAGPAHSYTSIIVRPDGVEVPVSINTHETKNDRGKVVSIIGTYQDTTAWTEVQQILIQKAQALENSEAMMKLSQQIAKIGTFSCDLDMKNVEWSDSLYQMLGKSREAVVPDAETWVSMIHPDDLYLTSEYDKFREGVSLEYRMIKESGEVMYVNVISSKMPSNSGRLIGTVQDVTEQKLQRQMVLHSEKLASLGEVYAGVAHEINQPLLGLELTLSTLQKLATEEKFKTAIGKSLGMITRISKIVQGLKNYSRAGSPDEPIVPVSVDSIVSEALTVCSFMLDSRGINLKLEISPEAHIHCRKGQMVQVLVNLISNAADAVEGLENRWIKIQTATVKRHLQVCVTDSGTGVSDDILEKMFQPFFTTKPTNKGTGIGLSISKSIVESMDGQISAMRDANENTAVSVLFATSR
jgi:PAS domain S-box-containing protein